MKSNLYRSVGATYFFIDPSAIRREEKINENSN